MNFKTRLMAHELLSGFTFGFFVAVQGIMILEKGVEVWQIGLLFGTVVVSTALFELPFGALADIHGRIKIYRVSRVFFILAIIGIIFVSNFWLILIAMAVLGIAEALNSGTVDAWAVEQINIHGEKKKLQLYLSAFQSSLAAGLAIGAVLGGYFPKIMPALENFPPTTWNLIFTAALAIVHLLLTPYLFREGEPRSHDIDKKEITKLIGNAVRFSLTHTVVRDILFVGLVLGLAMVSIEAYWQPQLMAISGTPTYTLLGWATAGYFAMAIVGPILITKIAEWTNASPAIQLKVLPFILALAMFVIASQTAIGPYLAAYMGVMLFISMFNAPGMTILNNEVTDEIRSTMQSIYSLVLRGGGAVSAFAFSVIIRQWDIETAWRIIAVIVLMFAVYRVISTRKSS